MALYSYNSGDNTSWMTEGKDEIHFHKTTLNFAWDIHLLKDGVIFHASI